MLDAATEVVLDVGVRAFTIEEVARRSGVAKTTIYRHFPSKHELLVTALDRALPIPVTPDTGSLREDLVVFLESVLPIFADPDIRAITLDIYAVGARDPELLAMQAKMMAHRAGPTLAIYEHGRARGEIAEHIDYATAFEIIEGPFIVRSLAQPGSLADLDLEALADRIARTLAGE